MPERRSRRRDARIGVRVALLMLAVLALAGCGALEQQTPGTLGVRSAQVFAVAGNAVLELGLDCRLSGPMQDALDHGIPITFAIDVRAGSWSRTLASTTQHVELRYFPLSRRYLLREVGVDDVRSYASQAHLLAGLGSLRLTLPREFAQLPAGAPLHVRAAIDATALPGALRLPALFEPAWRLASTDSTWPAATR